MKNSYYAQNGKHQQLAERLMALLPETGPVPLKRQYVALERYRQALHCYYDLHNNRLANRAREAAKVFGFGSAQHKMHDDDFAPIYYEKVEARMDLFVKQAAIEQGWIDD